MILYSGALRDEDMCSLAGFGVGFFLSRDSRPDASLTTGKSALA